MHAAFWCENLSDMGTSKTIKTGYYKDVKKIGCEDGRWMQLAQDHIQYREGKNETHPVSNSVKNGKVGPVLNQLSTMP
jgi:hypothetical protein